MAFGLSLVAGNSVPSNSVLRGEFCNLDYDYNAASSKIKVKNLWSGFLLKDLLPWDIECFIAQPLFNLWDHSTRGSFTCYASLVYTTFVEELQVVHEKKHEKVAKKIQGLKNTTDNSGAKNRLGVKLQDSAPNQDEPDPPVNLFTVSALRLHLPKMMPPTPGTEPTLRQRLGRKLRKLRRLASRITR